MKVTRNEESNALELRLDDSELETLREAAVVLRTATRQISRDLPDDITTSLDITLDCLVDMLISLPAVRQIAKRTTTHISLDDDALSYTVDDVFDADYEGEDE